MTLYTKSMLYLPEDTDGIRICIMRNIRVYNRHKFLFNLRHRRPIFDIHLVELAPSTSLKDLYKKNMIEWNQFSEFYTKEVLFRESELVSQIANYCLENNATLLCSEHTSEKCHRSLVASECQKYQPGLQIMLD